MRFSCKIFLAQGTEIPNDYRRYLLSIIKEAIKKSSDDGEEFYNKYYSDNNTKPFTFSAYFPLQKEGERSLLNGDFFNFFFPQMTMNF